MAFPVTLDQYSKAYYDHTAEANVCRSRDAIWCRIKLVKRTEFIKFESSRDAEEADRSLVRKPNGMESVCRLARLLRTKIPVALDKSSGNGASESYVE